MRIMPLVQDLSASQWCVVAQWWDSVPYVWKVTDLNPNLGPWASPLHAVARS